MPRGIQNVSGVSCHISCALQLLAHCIPPLIALYQQEILPSSPSSPSSWSCSEDGVILQELGRIICALVVTDEKQQADTCSPVDPTRLYELLENQGRLKPQDVGDVSTAVHQLWQILSKSNEEWKGVVDYLVLDGQTVQIICGKKVVETDPGDHSLLIRRKHGRVKRMACPFPLPIIEANIGKDKDEAIPSIEDILRGLCQASMGTRLEAYDWEMSSKESSYTEERVAKVNHVPTSDSRYTDGGGPGEHGGNDWETTKSMQIVQLPRYFFLTLDRFSYTAEGERIWKHRRMVIPPVLDLSDCLLSKTCHSRLVLKGGVLHVSEDSIVEEGHYVTLISNHSSSLAESWTLIDDDACQIVGSETALQWMSGAKDEGGMVEYCAVLLVYGPEESMTGPRDDDSSDWSQLVAKMRAQLQNEGKAKEEAMSIVDWSHPESLIGRKLKVRWAKGRFYQGIVESFDPSTGKHRVVYEDGDVREYLLSKKEIEWL